MTPQDFFSRVPSPASPLAEDARAAWQRSGSPWPCGCAVAHDRRPRPSRGECRCRQNENERGDRITRAAHCFLHLCLPGRQPDRYFPTAAFSPVARERGKESESPPAERVAAGGPGGGRGDEPGFPLRCTPGSPVEHGRAPAGAQDNPPAPLPGLIRPWGRAPISSVHSEKNSALEKHYRWSAATRPR